MPHLERFPLSMKHQCSCLATTVALIERQRRSEALKKREPLARVHVRLEPGPGVLQARKSQALRYAKIVLVGMTADTTRGRPKVCLVALFVSSMCCKSPYRPNEPERAESSQPVKPPPRIRL